METDHLTAGEDPVVQEVDAREPLLDQLKTGLFKDTKNTVLSVVFGLIVLYTAWRGFQFVFMNDKLTPAGDQVNSWRVISEQLSTYMVGNSFAATGIGFPMLSAAILLTAFTVGFAAGPTKDQDVLPMRTSTKVAIGGPPLVAMFVLAAMTETIMPKLLTVAVIAVFGLGLWLPRVLPESEMRHRNKVLGISAVMIFLLETGFSPANIDDFGGLLLTVNVAFVSIVLCFPIGILMALARRSSFPLIRPLAVAYIELIRGVPLITLLFMGQYALGFFLPAGTDAPPATIRAIIMFTLFSAAYVAEIVRGGLQSVHSGQTEAGQAVGLSAVTISRRIVLPQALRNSIPALVGQFIALLKDTTLLIIISQFDLLGVSDPILANPQFQNQGYTPEVYAFVAFMFWVMCFSMSRASQRLETKLGVGTR